MSYYRAVLLLSSLFCCLASAGEQYPVDAPTIVKCFLDALSSGSEESFCLCSSETRDIPGKVSRGTQVTEEEIARGDLYRTICESTEPMSPADIESMFFADIPGQLRLLEECHNEEAPQEQLVMLAQKYNLPETQSATKRKIRAKVRSLCAEGSHFFCCVCEKDGGYKRFPSLLYHLRDKHRLDFRVIRNRKKTRKKKKRRRWTRNF